MNIQEIEKSEKEFEEYLDEIYGDVEICGMKFSSGRALKELDPIAFRCAMSDEPFHYRCGECNKEYEEDELEEAEECCRPNDCSALSGSDDSHTPNPGKIVEGGALCVECDGFIKEGTIK